VAVAIVLAGGQKADLNRDKEGFVAEAAIRIGKRFMIEYVVAALRQSAYIDRIIIAGPLATLNAVFQERQADLSFVEGGDDQIGSFLLALQTAAPFCQENERILIVAADIPLLTTESIDDFIGMCQSQDAQMFYPIVTKETNESKYPGSVRTYVTLQEGTFTGGNLILIKAGIVDRCIPVAQKLIAYRKSPLRLASYIGFGILLKYLCGALSVKDAEEKVSSLMGIRAAAVVSSYAEIGIDVDKFSDMIVVDKYLRLTDMNFCDKIEADHSGYRPTTLVREGENHGKVAQK